MEETIGQKLRQAREARSLTLEQVSRATHMRVHYLEAMEAGDFEAVPSLAQARGFLRAYADFLNLEPQPLLEALDGSAPAVSLSPPPAVPERPAAEITPVSEEAEAVFAEVGQHLQQQRELLGLSLEDVVRHTHLRPHYLEALEAGDLDSLPSPVQGRGMLKNYATFLGIDPDPLLLRFAEGLQARLAARQAAHSTVSAKTRPTSKRRHTLPAPMRRLLSSDILIGGTLAIFLSVFVIWGAIRIFSMNSEQAPSPTVASIADVLLTTPTATATLTPAAPSASPPAEAIAAPPTETPATGTAAAASLPEGKKQGVQVYVTVHQRAFMRVDVDGKVEFQGRVLPGSAYTYVGDKQVEILTGNGAALQIFFGQQDLGLMGSFGQVVDWVFTPEGINTPTPTVTPTGTATPRPSPTLRPTATPRPGTPTIPPLP